MSKASFNFFKKLTAELQIIVLYYESKLLERQLMHTSYRQIIRVEFKFWGCSEDHYRKSFNRFVYLYIGTKIVEAIDTAAFRLL